MKLDYLITGGKGFIGRNLLDFLEENGKRYVTVDIDPRPYNGTDENICIDSSLHLPSIESKTLVHLASETNVRKSVKEPVSVIRRNMRSILNCLELLRSRVFEEMIFTSSANSKLCTNPYLASKMSSECICDAYKQSYDLKIRVLKLSNVYGPHSIHKHSVIPTFIRNCLDKKPLKIFGDGSQKRDFVYVGDVVDSIYYGKEGAIASGELYSIKTIAYMLSELSVGYLGYRPEIVYEEAVKGEVVNAVKWTDIVPKVGLEDGLSLTFNWFLEHYGAQQMVTC